MRIRRGPIAGIVALACVVGATAQARLMAVQAATPPAQGAAAPPAQSAPAQPAPEQQDFAMLSQLVDGVSSGQQPAPTGVPGAWRGGHFIKSQGDTVYIPFTIAIDRSQLATPAIALYVRVVKDAPAAAPADPPAPGTRPTYAWDTIHFIDVPADGRLSRAIALPAGNYQAFIAFKDRGTGQGAAPGAATGSVGLIRQALTVPAFAGSELTTSSVLLARSMEQLTAPLPAEQQQDHPYVFGTLGVTPAVDATFTKGSSLNVLFWIYNASHTAGKPDVQVEFSFHHRLPGGELKYFNKTAPQPMNASTLPPEFDLMAGHQLLSSLVIPLASFAEGDYRLEITVRDTPSGMSLTRNVDFTVSA
jgi:hypothetical protein